MMLRLSGLLGSFLLTLATLPAEDRDAEIVQSDRPVAWWRFEGTDTERLRDHSGNQLHATQQGKIGWEIAGPRPSEYPDFAAGNQGANFPKGKNYLVVSDPGDNSLLDFANGDAITLEAWVRLEGVAGGSYPYIISKGRTQNPGTPAYNQNYSLRLATQNGGSALTFFFVDDETPHAGGSIGDDGHRWTSNDHVPDDGAWHHIAVTYEFGNAKSIKGYIDGQPTAGKWDLGGASDKRPVVDNDELWIGSAMGGGSTFGGSLDEVAIYRTALPAERIQAHARINWTESRFALGKVDPAVVPADRVRVEIVEGLPVARKWTFRIPREPELLYETDLFALKTVPPKYNEQGLIADRPVPSLLHLCSQVELAAGEYEFLLRSLDASRLYINGELVAETGFKQLSGDAHHPYYVLPKFGPELLSIPADHQERRVKLQLPAGRHLISLYRLLGNKGAGQHLGEMSVAISAHGEPFRFLSPVRELPYTDAGWLTFLDEDRIRQRDWNQQLRLAKSTAEREYWDRRHAYARSVAEPVEVPPGQAGHPVDRFIEQRLAELGKEPQDLVDDYAFLKRACLDTLGTIPTREQLAEYFRDPPETRRELLVERLLKHPAWADHWVGYWQDVLAENPGLTKPELNNTGPFRWFLYEALLDNMPLDRFVTELIMLRGSTWMGGPAGFAVASQNDVPMAAKAHVLGTAFLAVEMKCARCHDAPYHDVQQEDLFGLAAMLRREAQPVPGTSSIPADPEKLARMAVKVTLPPGSMVKPNWPFVEFLTGEKTETVALTQALPEHLWRDPADSREQLAAMLTSPHNQRFSKVLANRIWQRFFGRALIEPVDDWEHARTEYPQLLDYLASELVTHNYDLKHLSRVLMTSQAYQRKAVVGWQRESDEAGLFRGPLARKLTGEQIMDSLYLASGKSFDSEELTMDADGRLSEATFGHLGIPYRAWQLVAVSNERDRPSMTLPVAQSVVDALAAFGWRQQRQDPLTTRSETVTALQPLALAHGTAPNRVVDFSDYSALTGLALRDQPVEEFVEELYLRILSRQPSSVERELFVELLRPGYEARVVAGPEVVQPKRLFRSGITWATHFAPESDNEAMERMREILHGDPPTAQLDADWRSRAEDAVWTLINSPEFVFVP